MFDTERFILEIQQNDCIWKKQAKRHHNHHNLLHDAWTNVARVSVKNFDEFDEKKKNQKIKELKFKWKNIRDAYRKKCFGKNAKAVKTSKKYVYADLLQFIIPTLETIKTEGNAEKYTDEESISVNNSAVDIPATDSEEELPISPKKKIKKVPLEQSSVPLVSVMSKHHVEDPVTLFLMSLAPQIRSLSQDQQNNIYIEFITTIQKVKNSNNLNQS